MLVGIPNLDLSPCKDITTLDVAYHCFDDQHQTRVLDFVEEILCNDFSQVKNITLDVRGIVLTAEIWECLDGIIATSKSVAGGVHVTIRYAYSPFVWVIRSKTTRYNGVPQLCKRGKLSMYWCKILEYHRP